MGIDFRDRASPIVTTAESPRQRRPQSRSAAHTATPRSGQQSLRPKRIASFPSHHIAISRRVEPRCTASVVEWAMDSTTVPRAATPQLEARPDVQIMDVPERQNEPATPAAAAAAPDRRPGPATECACRRA
eukprot:365593-Chlamydomonas_euryale.AAC.4